jgi:hypothetical protein
MKLEFKLLSHPMCLLQLTLSPQTNDNNNPTAFYAYGSSAYSNFKTNSAQPQPKLQLYTEEEVVIEVETEVGTNLILF